MMILPAACPTTAWGELRSRISFALGRTVDPRTAGAPPSETLALRTGWFPLAGVFSLPAWQTSWWFLSLLGVTLVGVALTLCRSRSLRLRQERESKEALSRRMLASQEKERHRIASELHDSLGQDLLIIKNRCLLALASTDDHGAVRTQLDGISKLSSEAIEEVRRVAHSLGTHHLEHLGFTEALATMIEQVAASTPLAIETHLEPIDDLLDAKSAISLYRVVQEALNNVIKHAQAGSARVDLQRDLREIRLLIQDHGCGFEAGRAIQGSFGLADMAERIHLLGGVFDLVSHPGRGTRLNITLPIKEELPPAKRRNGRWQALCQGG